MTTKPRNPSSRQRKPAASKPSKRLAKTSKSKANKVAKNADKAHMFLTRWVQLAPSGSPMPVSEYPFSKIVNRRHRADWAWPENKLLLEVDGGKYARGGGRHAGDKDKEKINLAVELGYQVLRYSPDMLEENPLAVVNQVLRCLGCREAGD